MKKNLVVDIDDVLTPTGELWNKASNAHFGLSLKYDNLTSFDFDYIDIGLKEEFRKFLFDFVYKKLIDFPALGLKTIQCLNSKYNLFTCSDREERCIPDSKKWLDKHYNGLFSGHFFTKKLNTTKPEVCLNLNAVGAIEDAPHNIEAISSQKIMVYMMNTPWNLSIEDNKFRKRVSSLKEVENIINP